MLKTEPKTSVNQIRPPETCHHHDLSNMEQFGGYQQPIHGSSRRRYSKIYLGKYQVCCTQGHFAKQWPLFRMVLQQYDSNHTYFASPQWSLQAYNTMFQQPKTSSWLMDSGSSHLSLWILPICLCTHLTMMVMKFLW